MNKPGSSLKELERRAYRSTFEDGIYDLQFGFVFLVLALIPVLEAQGISRYVGYGLLIALLILPWVGKRLITIPRMGEVQFGPQRRKRRLYIWVAAAVVLVLTLPLLIMMSGQNPFGGLEWRLLVVFVLPLFVLAVYTTDFPRLYIYAALLIFTVVEAEFTLQLLGSPGNALLSFGLPGVIITGIGVALLIRFIKTYPRKEVDVDE